MKKLGFYRTHMELHWSLGYALIQIAEGIVRICTLGFIGVSWALDYVLYYNTKTASKEGE